jgi:ATP-binding cassette, subfamily B, bacterial
MGMLMSAVFLFISNWTLALIFTVWLVLLFSYTIRRGKKFGKLVEIESQSRSQASGLVVDALANNMSVRVFNARKRELGRLSKQQDDIIKKWRASWGFHIITNLVKGNSIAVVGAVSFSIMLVLFNGGEISVGDVTLFITYFTAASSAIWELSWQLDMYYRSFGTIDNALNGLSAGEKERQVPSSDSTLSPAAYEVELNNVEFHYPDQPKVSVLKNINILIPQGQRIGLVGHSGAGKTTLVGLLLGFYEPTEGEYLIGGISTKLIDPSQLRELVAYVPQDTNLFNRTIKENIAYAKPDATLQEIKKAAKDAQALDFIEKLPHKFDTLIGERGVKLSGGQRQRIAIARALLKDTPIVLLDEATSALDSVSEQAIQKALSAAMTGRTAIVVAHRLSTLKHLDHILVFDNGQIAEQGSHQELLDSKGIYADLWRRQRDGFIAD